MANANAIWSGIPTPLYDELKSQHLWHDSKGNKERYDIYVKRLKEKYPGCSVRVPTYRNVEQPWNAAAGQNHLGAFFESEKLCQLNRLYKGVSNFRTGTGPLNGLSSLNQVLKRKAAEEKQYVNRQRKIQEAQNKAERLRLSKIPTGNLLELNKKNEPDMLRFEPTKNGLNNRSRELNGLFRKSRKNRKSRTTRKGRK
jgi:hypothetical protein